MKTYSNQFEHFFIHKVNKQNSKRERKNKTNICWEKTTIQTSDSVLFFASCVYATSVFLLSFRFVCLPSLNHRCVLELPNTYVRFTPMLFFDRNSFRFIFEYSFTQKRTDTHSYTQSTHQWNRQLKTIQTRNSRCQLENKTIDYMCIMVVQEILFFWSIGALPFRSDVYYIKCLQMDRMVRFFFIMIT